MVKSIEDESGNKKIYCWKYKFKNGKRKIKDGIKLNKDDELEISEWVDERKVINELQINLNVLTISEKIQQLANDIKSKNTQISSNQIEKISDSFRILKQAFNNNKDLD